MNKTVAILFLTISFIFLACKKEKETVYNTLFDFDWKFALGDYTGAMNPDFNDSEWKMVDIPHDFSIEQPFDSFNTTGRDGGYTYNGIAWYRKHFKMTPESSGKRTILLFNGIYRNSETWINGHYLGLWPYGYSSFYYDLSPYLKSSGEENILAVKINTTDQPNSRWYTGAGIYRHVWLITTGLVHFNPWGIYAKTLKLQDNKALIDISVEAVNESLQTETCEITTTICDTNGYEVQKVISNIELVAGDSQLINQKVTLDNPFLWSIDNPYLYKLQTTIRTGNEIQDIYTCNYGIRTFYFDADKGFFLNGKHIKLKGTNNHHDGGPLGAACMDYTFERQLLILKSMGSNALRMSHNPPAPELLDCADRMGFVVIDEIFDEWIEGKKPYGYSPHFKEWYKKDIANWIRRDRNHPSVIAWSLGNEVVEQRRENGAEVLQLLIDEASKHDTTRPFTAACNEILDANKNGLSGLLDIVGYNYQEPNYLKDHKKYAGRVIFGSETVIYPYHPGDRFPLHSYEQWLGGQLDDYVAGEFLWTGFDYMGESGIGAGGTSYEPWLYWPKWPWRSADCGVVDLCGFEKPAYFYRKAIWSNEPVLYMAVQTDPSARNKEICAFWGWPKVWPHWNYNKKGDSLAVHVYTNLPEVELFLNNKSLGIKKWELHKEAFLTWEVPYQPGSLEAVGMINRMKQKTFKLNTTGKPAAIVMTSDRSILKANKQDISYIKIQVVDADNNQVAFADNLIIFEISGAGKLRAVGNGDPASHTPFNGAKMEAFHGQCLAIVQSGEKKGEIVLIAKSEGISGAEVTLKVE